MASDVQVVNYALMLMGNAPITSLGDDTASAQIASTVIDIERDAVLRAHPWNCAITRASLGLLSTSPAFGWKYQYQLPTDPWCLFVLALNDDEQCGYPGDDHKVEGRKLLTNSPTANIRYIKRITDPNEYDALFFKSFGIALAVAMTRAVNSSDTALQSFLMMYEKSISEAKTRDGQEGSPDRSDVTTLLDVR